MILIFDLGLVFYHTYIYLHIFTPLPWNDPPLETCDGEDDFQMLYRPKALTLLRSSAPTCPCLWLCRACVDPSLDHDEVHLQHDTTLVHDELSSSG